MEIETLQRIRTFLEVAGVASIFFLVFFSPVLIIRKIYRKISPKQYKPKGGGYVSYAPPHNMGPLLCGYLLDNRINSRDIVAGFMYLAEEGFISITKRFPDKYMHGEKHKYAHMNSMIFSCTLLKRVPKTNTLEARLFWATWKSDLVGETVDLHKIVTQREYRIAKRIIHKLLDQTLISHGFAKKSLLSRFFPVLQTQTINLTREGQKVLQEIKGYREYLATINGEKFEHILDDRRIEFFVPHEFSHALALGTTKAFKFDAVFLDPEDTFLGGLLTKKNSLSLLRNTAY